MRDVQISKRCIIACDHVFLRTHGTNYFMATVSCCTDRRTDTSPQSAKYQHLCNFPKSTIYFAPSSASRPYSSHSQFPFFSFASQLKSFSSYLIQKLPQSTSVTLTFFPPTPNPYISLFYRTLQKITNAALRP